MAVFIVLWFTTKLRSVICHNIGHSMPGAGATARRVAVAAVRRYASPKKINGKWRGIGPFLIGAQSPVLWHHLSKGVNGLLPKD